MSEIQFNVGSLKKDPGYGTITVDVQRSDGNGTAYPVIECSILRHEDRFYAGVSSYCSSRHPLSLEQHSIVFSRVRGFIKKHEQQIRSLMQ